jgi:hypothetical protein
MPELEIKELSCVTLDMSQKGKPFAANAVAPSNMFAAFSSLEVSHFRKSPLNVVVEANIFCIVLALPVFHSLKSRLIDVLQNVLVGEGQEGKRGRKGKMRGGGGGWRRGSRRSAEGLSV